MPIDLKQPKRSGYFNDHACALTVASMIAYAHRRRDLARLIYLNLRFIVYSLAERAWDFWYGIDTRTGLRGFESLAGLTLVGDAKGAADYSPTPYGILRRVFAALPIERSRYSFVDFGSGKGRVLVIAAKHRFKQIIGVEFAQEFFQASQRNLQAANVTAMVRLCDARNFTIPLGPCVLFFFNPFAEDIMDRVVENIVASHRSEPRHLIVVYYHAAALQAFTSHPGFIELATVHEGWFDRLGHSGRYPARILEMTPPPITIDPGWCRRNGGAAERSASGKTRRTA